MSKDTTGTYEGTSRRKVIQTIGAGAVGTALAGCGDLLGVEEPGEGQLTIGHIAPLGSVLGVGSERAAEMAKETVNNNGGVMDSDVEVVTKDTLVQASEAEGAVEELINQDNANVIVGAFQSEVGRAIVDLTSEFGVPYISTGPAAPELTAGFVGEDYEQYKHYFRVGPINSALQAEAMADYLTYLSDRHGWNSCAFYRDQAAWTEVFGRDLPGLLDEQGITVENNNGNGEAITIQDPDLGPVVSSAEELGVDYVLRFFAHISSSPSQLLGPWKQGQLNFGIEGIHVPGMHPEYDIATEGLNIYETTSQSGAGGAAPITEHTQPFIEEYVSNYAGDSFDPGTPDGSPMYMGFGTYDAILLLQNVLNEIGTTTPADSLDDYVDAMLSQDGSGIETISGGIQFYGPDEEYPHDLMAERDSDGSITNFPVTQFQPYDGGNVATVEYDGIDRPGQVECVFPESFRTAEHQQPNWMA
ncbi:ABC transporter substrate-binding protein [Halovenus sp. WSH3]|uniref:ABC transporter substrate-binding protein n=1 Tax=Halovenus carboxidivorans TaxID=2692199 RepID=A0A6B0SZ25_9EURY|nr:ABC transporter substrate-binding protein [Halovenus carboxidivorans]MXR51058.1 ABC transporter substrate-binding protein [Halovenus carboxidivorans]